THRRLRETERRPLDRRVRRDLPLPRLGRTAALPGRGPLRRAIPGLPRTSVAHAVPVPLRLVVRTRWLHVRWTRGQDSSIATHPRHTSQTPPVVTKSESPPIHLSRIRAINWGLSAVANSVGPERRCGRKHAAWTTTPAHGEPTTRDEGSIGNSGGLPLGLPSRDNGVVPEQPHHSSRNDDGYARSVSAAKHCVH